MEGAGGPRFERLHDSLALAIISRLTERHDMRSLAQTSKRLCRLVGDPLLTQCGACS
jgi:hypothetical protein